MNSIVKESKEIFQRAIVALIEGYEEEIKQHVDVDHRGKAKVNGIELLIYPWFGYFYLSLRPMGRLKVRDGLNSRADWNEYGDHNAPWAKEIKEQDKAIEYMVKTYDNPPIEVAGQDHVAHLLFLGAAEALLDKSVCDALLERNIPAVHYSDDFPNGTFEYMIFDDDKSTINNYCEHVLLNRITDRYKSK